MKLERLHLQGFLSYIDEEIPFEDITYCVVTGKNGQGKSSIAHAITWCLFGEPPVRDGRNDVVNDSCDQATVIAYYSAPDGTRFRVERTIVRDGKMTVKLEQDKGGQWVVWGSQKSSDNQQRILQLFDTTLRAYQSLRILDQSPTSTATIFARTAGDNRREVLLDLLPELDVWADLEAQADDERRACKERLGTLDGKLAQLDDDLDETEQLLEETEVCRDPDEVESDLDAARKRLNALKKSDVKAEIEDLQERLARAEESLQDAEDAAESELDSLQAQCDALDKKQQAINDGEDELARLKALASKSQQERKELVVQSKRVETDIARLEQVCNDCEDALSSAKASETTVKEQLDEIAERLRLLKSSDGECWTCGSPLSASQIRQLRSQLEAQSNELKGSVKDLGIQIKALTKDLDAAEDELLSLRQDHEEILEETRQIDRDSAVNDEKISSLREKLTSLKAEVREEKGRTKNSGPHKAIEQAEKKWDDRLEKLKGEVERLDGLLKAAKSRTRDDDDIESASLEEEITSLQAELREVIAANERVRGLRERLKRFQKSRSEAEKELKETEYELEILEFLKAACAPKGIPSFLLDEILGEIEERWNQILRTIPGTEDWRVEFQQSRPLKSREGSKEVLDIMVTNSFGYTRRIETYSTGQMVRLTMSCIFAMTQVINERRGKEPEIMFLDEPLGSLDLDAVPAFVDVLTTAINEGWVDQMLVVSHDQRVIDALPQKMVVNATQDRGSLVELTA